MIPIYEPLSPNPSSLKFEHLSNQRTKTALWLVQDTYPYMVIWLVPDTHTTLYANIEFFFSITQKWVRKCVFKQITKKLLVHPWHQRTNLHWSVKQSFSILDLQEHIYVALFDENFKPFEFMYKMYKSI